MNVSKELGFIWWATAGCASRSTSMYITDGGCDDLFNSDTVYVEGYKDAFKVTVYENASPRYIPYL